MLGTTHHFIAVDFCVTIKIMDDEASSGSVEGTTPIDGHDKSEATLNTGCVKRSRKTNGDAIVSAVLDIAASSKRRAAAILKDTSAGMDDFDLALDEMELVASVVGYYYYNHLSRRPPRNRLSPGGSGFVSEVLNGCDDVCRQTFRMDKHVFHKLCDVLRQRGMLRDTPGVIVEEQLAIFFSIVGHNERNRVIQERFQHSGETISRHFNNVLKAIKSLSREFLLSPPPLATPPKIQQNYRYYPYFKDCIGVIDGMHIPAHVPAKDQSSFRNRRGDLSQNVLVACTFDLQFIFVYPGWEGSASNSRVLQAVLDDPYQNFPPIPQGRYYLVDMGYPNMEGFMAPFSGVPYHPYDYPGMNHLPGNAKELFNHRHACLRQAIWRCSEALKMRFPILRLAPQYAFRVQRDIVIAACVLHNFIRAEEQDDWLFARAAEMTAMDGEDPPGLVGEGGLQLCSTLQEEAAVLSLRDSIAAAMWSDFLDNWAEW